MASYFLPKLCLISFIISSILAYVVPVAANSAIRRIRRLADPVVIDKDGVYIRATPMADGSILAGYAAQEGSQHVLRVVRSVDGARSWQRVGEVYRAETATHDVDNAMPVQLANGRLLYAYRNHDRTADGRYTFYRLSVSYSDDKGKSWKFLSQIEERAAGGQSRNGLWEAFLRLAEDGTVQAYYSSTNENNNNENNMMKYSRDGGQTWRGPIIVSGGDRPSMNGMMGVAALEEEGSLM